MYICPMCEKEFDSEEEVSKHYMKCWRDKNPQHKSKPAHRSEDTFTREVNNDILNFFNSFNSK